MFKKFSIFLCTLFLGSTVNASSPLEAGSMNVCDCQPRDGGTMTIGTDWALPYPWKSSEAHTVITPVFGNLYINDPYNDKLIPDLATHWEVSKDKTKGTFHLRKGVKFHDGTPFTAKDVEWSIRLTMKPEAEGSDFLSGAARLKELKGAQDFIDGKTKKIAGVKVIDDHTIVLETAVPNGQFFDVVGKVYILPEHLFTKYSWEELPKLDWFSPEVRVGTGPFKMEEFVEAQYVSYVANENYWAGRPHLDRIVFRLFKEHETSTLAFEKGEIDVLSFLTAEEVKRFGANPEGNVMLRGTPLSPNYINITDKPYFQDKRVRQALNYAINRQQLIDTLIPGIRDPMDSLFPEGHPMYNPNAKRFPYDPENARALLKEAGWDPNQVVDLSTYYTSQEALDWLAFVQMYLTRVGIKTKVRQMPWPDLEKAGQAGELELWLTGYSRDVIGDHMAYFGPEGTWNYGKYNNSKYHDLMTKASRSGGDELKKIFFEMQEIFNEEVPALPFWNRTKFNMVKPKVCNTVEPWTDQHFGYRNFENVFICENSKNTVSVRPKTPSGLGHPGYRKP